MVSIRNFLFLFFLAGLSGIAFGVIPDPPEDAPSWFTYVEWLLELSPFVVGNLALIFMAVLAILRGVGEILKLIVDKTATKVDNAVLKVVLQLVKWVSKMAIWLGIGSGK